MKPRKKREKRRKLTIIGLACTVAALGAVTAAGAVYLAPYTRARMDMTLLEIADAGVPATLLVYDPILRGDRVGGLTSSGRSVGDIRPRPHVPFADMPPDLIHAFISIEDKRFYRHRGVDPIRTARATWGYLAGNPAGGGSTITQQLVKNLTGQCEQTPDRKLTEIFCAMDLERQIGKEAVLEAYLNVINLAEGCFGVGMAAETYFQKSVSDLTLPECAALAAITQNPSRFDPITHPAENTARRDLILSCMAEQGYITAEELREALSTPLILNPAPRSEAPPVTDWYTDLVVSDVIRDLMERRGYTYEAASRLVYCGGLTVETAMDEELQRTVETYYADLSHFPTGEEGRPRSSFLLIDPQTGDILAVAGDAGVKTASRIQSYATDTRRPAGSCIKPLSVYAPALEGGLYTWRSILSDEPVSESGGRPWPANADGLYRGRIPLAEAVARSLNPPAVEVLEGVGLRKSFDFVRETMGLHSLISPTEGDEHDCTVSSLALGQQSVGVTSRELTAAYTALYGGLYREAVSYHRVLDREGNVLLENPPTARRVLSEETAAILTRLLMEVNDPTAEGTAARYLRDMPAMGIETAGKTGTTQKGCDRRYIGMTPRLLAGVWMGYDYPATQGGINGNPCVGIWDELMALCEGAYRGAPDKTAFDIPDTLIETEFCPLSGHAPNPYCTDALGGGSVRRGWFIKGTEPTALCELHEEPPIRVTPADPRDPDRIPLLPNDVLPEESDPSPETPSAREPFPWFSKWFSRFSRR